MATSSESLLTVNLLPSSSRAMPSKLEQLHRTPLMWLLGGSMILLPLGFLIPLSVERYQLQRLTTKLHALEPRKADVDRLQQGLKELRTQETTFQGLKVGQGLWAKRLNVLSDILPEGVW